MLIQNQFYKHQSKPTLNSWPNSEGYQSEMTSLSASGDMSNLIESQRTVMNGTNWRKASSPFDKYFCTYYIHNTPLHLVHPLHHLSGHNIININIIAFWGPLRYCFIKKNIILYSRMLYFNEKKIYSLKLSKRYIWSFC